MTWMHEISQSALAAAVLMLGVVILLELRSIARLRRAMDGSLARLFEQLDLLRFENQQLLEAHENAREHAPRQVAKLARMEWREGTVPAAAPAVPVAPAIAPPTTLPAGEAKLLASLAAARAKRAEAATRAAS